MNWTRNQAPDNELTSRPIFVCFACLVICGFVINLVSILFFVNVATEITLLQNQLQTHIENTINQHGGHVGQKEGKESESSEFISLQSDSQENDVKSRFKRNDVRHNSGKSYLIYLVTRIW